MRFHQLTIEEQSGIIESFGEPDSLINVNEELSLFANLHCGGLRTIENFCWSDVYIDEIKRKLPYILNDGFDIVVLFIEMPENPRRIYTWFRRAYFELDIKMYTHERGNWYELTHDGDILFTTRRENRSSRRYTKRKKVLQGRVD